MKKNTVLINIATSLFLQIVTIISGFVIPRLIISEFGSNVNGLLSSITQFLSYISLLEGGLSGVVMASLYKPLADNDFKKVSGVVNAALRFFRQIAIIYIVYVFVLAFVYPLIVPTGYSKGYIFGLVVVLAGNLFIQYFFSLTYKLLLNADRKVYYVSLTQILIVVTNLILTVVAIKLFGDVLWVKLFSLVAYVLQPILYTSYVKKHYKLDKAEKPDNKALSQRWDGFGQNIAYFIHVNTPIVILTFFCDLKTVSVYSVYLMIANALKVLSLSISSAIAPSIGNVLAKNNNDEANNAFDLYEFGMGFVVTLMFSAAMALSVPFVRVYTLGITDANYIEPVFCMLLMLAEMVYCLRDPYVSVIYAAGHFKQTAKYAYAEAAINIILSLALVGKFGITGVATGMLVSMIYRMVTQVWYLKNNILLRSLKNYIKNMLVFGCATFVIVYVSSNCFVLQSNNYISWFFDAVKTGIFALFIMILTSFVFYKKYFVSMIGSKLKKR